MQKPDCGTLREHKYPWGREWRQKCGRYDLIVRGIRFPEAKRAVWEAVVIDTKESHISPHRVWTHAARSRGEAFALARGRLGRQPLFWGRW